MMLVEATYSLHILSSLQNSGTVFGLFLSYLQLKLIPLYLKAGNYYLGLWKAI